ncbi:MAG: hypothetical protein ACOYWZ_19315, partial [Bacillota bacterium]
MLKLFRNNRGSTMVTVVIVTTVLIILSLLLLDSALQGISMARRSEHIDYTYYAGQSAIEKWFATIKKEENNVNFYATYGALVDITDPASIQNYVDWIINNKLPNNLLSTENINVLNSSAAEIKIKDIKNMGTGPITIVGNKVEIDIGITAEAGYENLSAKLNSQDKLLFAKKKFQFPIPQVSSPTGSGFMLEAPLYSIADLYVSAKNGLSKYSGFNASIYGDSYVFGTSSKNIIVPYQYFFGGIYAIDGAHLDIYGNAYSRSFIRAGSYLRSLSTSNYYKDESSILIRKDAIAQCIQGFGNDDKIVVYRNAYTFDDMELNGENSIIAVNGSYVGLTPFESGSVPNNHDTSSSIVNTAILHHYFSDASMMSRIVVNGDVLIGGTTYKIDPLTGVAVNEIENASLAFKEGLPYYKYSEGTYANTDAYHLGLRGASDIKGFANIFQKWTPLNLSLTSIETNIQNWLADINSVRKVGYNSFSGTVPTNISGFWTSEIAANDTLYRNGYNLADNNSNRASLSYLTASSYILDNIYVSNNLKYTGSGSYDTDSDGTNTTGYWNQIEDWSPSNADAHGRNSINIFGIFNQIKQDLLGKVHFFAEREYPVFSGTASAAVGRSWTIGLPAATNDNFNNIYQELKSRSGALSPRPNFIHMDQGFTTNPLYSGLDDIQEIHAKLKYSGITPAPSPDLYQKCFNSRTTNDDYYFV